MYSGPSVTISILVSELYTSWCRRCGAGLQLPPRLCRDVPRSDAEHEDAAAADRDEGAVAVAGDAARLPVAAGEGVRRAASQTAGTSAACPSTWGSCTTGP